jgi:hypothetical protein
MHYAHVKATQKDGTQVVAHVTNYETLFIPPAQGGFGAQRYGKPGTVSFSSTRTLPSTRVDWELGQLPHYGVHAMQQSIIGRLKKKNIHIGHPARLHSDIMNVVNEGVDTGLSFVTSNIPRLAMIEHIEWMNKTNTTPKIETDTLHPYLQDIARNDIETFLTASPSERERTPISSFKNIATDLLNRVPGMGSITPSLLDDCFDASTGLPITVADVMHRFGVAYSATNPDQATIPVDLFELLAQEKVKIPSPSGNMLPDDFLPVYDLGLLPIIRERRPPSSDHSVSIPHYNKLFVEYDQWFCLYWQQEHSHKYRF